MPQTRASPGRRKKRFYTYSRLSVIHPAIVEQAVILDENARIRQAAEEQERQSGSIPPAAGQPEKDDSAVPPANGLYE